MLCSQRVALSDECSRYRLLSGSAGSLAEEFGDPAGGDIPCRGRLAVSCWQRERFRPKTVSRPGTCTGYRARSKEQGRARGHNRGSTSGCGPVRAASTCPELHLSTLYRWWTFLCRFETTHACMHVRPGRGARYSDLELTTAIIETRLITFSRNLKIWYHKMCHANFIVQMKRWFTQTELIALFYG